MLSCNLSPTASNNSASFQWHEHCTCCLEPCVCFQVRASLAISSPVTEMKTCEKTHLWLLSKWTLNRIRICIAATSFINVMRSCNSNPSVHGTCINLYSNEEFKCKNRYISIFINLIYLQLKLLKNKANNNKIIFHHKFQNILCYVTSEVSLKR